MSDPCATLTDYFELSFTSREEAVWSKEQLLEAPPPSAPTRWIERASPPCPSTTSSSGSSPRSVATAIGMIVVRNAVHAALFLVVNFFTIAVMYLLLDAPFLFAVQIVVYAGAIMVLFLFVIMLSGRPRAGRAERMFGSVRPPQIPMSRSSRSSHRDPRRASVRDPVPGASRRTSAGTCRLADVLFRDYFFPFEVTSVLLIVAAVAAMVLALRRSKALTQREIEAHAGDDLEAYAMAPPGVPDRCEAGR